MRVERYQMGWISISLAVLAAFAAPLLMGWLSGTKNHGVVRLTDSGEWFRPSNRLRVFIALTTVVLISLFTLPLFTAAKRDLVVYVFCGCWIGFFLVVGVGGLVEMFTSYVFIDSDGLEYRRVWRTYRIDRAEIKGYSVIYGILFIDLRSGKSIRINKMIFANGRKLPYLVRDLMSLR